MSTTQILAGYTAQGTLQHDVRRLQESAGMSVVVECKKSGDRVMLSFSNDIMHQAMVHRVQSRLHLDTKLHAYNVVYGAPLARHDVIPIVTRPMLGIFDQIGAQVGVPAEDVARGRTRATIIDFPGAARSAILVQNGDTEPASSYTKIRYREHWYWVSEND